VAAFCYCEDKYEDGIMKNSISSSLFRSSHRFDLLVCKEILFLKNSFASEF
jgi:hypothetical protein